MAQETNKATERRRRTNLPFWNDVFGSIVLDVGPGDDPLVWGDAYVLPFDKDQGDANEIDKYFLRAVDKPATDFSCIHGSQVMEHLHNPADFIKRCLSILKPGGWIVMTIPDFDLYEKQQFPSRFNPDHKTTWSLWRKSGPSSGFIHSRAPHIFVPEWIRQFDVAHREAHLIDTNYDYLKPDSVDQTWLREDGVECFIEILLLKKFP